MIRLSIRKHRHGLTARISLRTEHKVRLRRDLHALFAGQRYLKFEPPQVFSDGQGITFLTADNRFIHFNPLAAYLGHGQRFQELRLEQAVKQGIHRNLPDIRNLLQGIATAQDLLKHIYRDPSGDLIDPVGLTVSVNAVIAAIFIGVGSTGAVLHCFEGQLEQIHHGVLSGCQLLQITGAARNRIINHHVRLANF